MTRFRFVLPCLLIAALAALSFAQEPPAQIKEALKRADAAVAKIIAIPDNQRNFENTLGAIDDISVRLDNETSMILFMQYVSTNAAERDASRAAEEAVSNWAIDLGKNEKLYKAVKAYADRKPTLTGERKRMLEHSLRDYRRSGMELSPEKREELKKIEMQLNKLGIEFEQNIAEDATKVPLLKSELPGVPDDVIKRQPTAGGLILVGLDGPTYGAVMDYCTNANTRQKMWVSYRRRAISKNVRTLEQLIKLRAQAAKLLGFKNTVDWMIETRMAKNHLEVRKFYTELEPIVRKKALLDMAEFRSFKRKHTKNPKADVNPWDYAFYKNLLKKEKYAVDSEKVMEYFPMQRVMDGLFSITQNLYGLEFKDITSRAKEFGLPVWHTDVKLYEVWDKAQNKTIGRFYLDLYPRENKYTHAAHWGLIPRKRWANGEVQIPLSALVCNFTKPTATKPSLMPHDEVETFFHEFGHLLHAMMSETEYGQFSGTAVARDFVEAPSQMFENWVWDGRVLKTFAKHYKTGKPLPESMLKGMLAARTLGSGIETQGQIFLGEMDQAFHTAPDGVVDTTKTGLEIYAKTTLYKPVPGTAFQASFGHLNGYEGAYYGYLWSLVYAQDMFQRFEQNGLLNPEAGKYYRQKVLSRGGSVDEIDMLRDYLGRAPKTEAFLRHLGLTTKPIPKKGK
jgi:thimet oligopeptidase